MGDGFALPFRLDEFAQSLFIVVLKLELPRYAGKRGKILDRTGEARGYRFRFGNPTMQPYVIMRGIRDRIVNEAAKQALSSPEQPDLFPTG